jgi:hypothetical protein
LQSDSRAAAPPVELPFGTIRRVGRQAPRADLRRGRQHSTSAGVTFEAYDGTNGPTENGVARANGGAAAWFIDSEGNILNISEEPTAS